MSNHTAVLFVVFNRPDTTRKVFEAIREARPPRLYVAADGSRDERGSERVRCEEVRRIATSVDWRCDVRTLFHPSNLGCRKAVSEAITWFFSREEEGIILEDDVLPHPSFFPYCEELLERYRPNENVMMISGDCFHGQNHRLTTSYFFSRYLHIWGWASWRRAWNHYDRDMTMWPGLKTTSFFRKLGEGQEYEAYWTEIFQMVYDGKIDTWDYQWLFAAMARGGLAVTPSTNLVKNIGFSQDATHTRGNGGWLAKVPVGSMRFPLVHPQQIVRNTEADAWEDKYVFGANMSLSRKFLRRLLSPRSLVDALGKRIVR